MYTVLYTVCYFKDSALSEKKKKKQVKCIGIEDKGYPWQTSSLFPRRSDRNAVQKWNRHENTEQD